MDARKQLLLAAALGLGVFAGLARAGDYPVPPGFPVVSEVVEDDAHPMPPGGHKRLKPRPHSALGAAKDLWLNRIPLFCYSHFNDYSCGGIHSEVAFHFGSCRCFFGERCIKTPPGSPVPGFDPASVAPPRRGCVFCR